MEEYFWRENEKKAIKQEEREELETRIHDLERKLERASRRGMFSFFRKGEKSDSGFLVLFPRVFGVPVPCPPR